jgi:endo-1,4-beta-xylanase
MIKKILPVCAAFLLLLACSFTGLAGTSTPTPMLIPPAMQTPIPSDTLVPTPTETAILTPLPPSLRNYAELKGILFGTYFPWQGFDDPQWRAIAGQEFDLAVIFDSFSWRDFEPAQGQFDFNFVDQQVEFAQANNMQICAHTLLWPSYEGRYPDWILKGNYSRQQLSQFLQDYITTVMAHYRGKITCWIVVEDPYFDSPDRSWDLLYSTFGGYDYIDFVYQVARQAGPQAMLIYNDGENITPDGERTELTRQIVQRLQQEGLVDGVGLEMHLDAAQSPDKQDVLATMQSYGMPVHVTEIDVNLAGVPGTQDERFLLQAQIYGDMLSACLESGVCASFSVWGFGDKYSYLERYYTDADPTLFDDNLRPKPAYYTLLDIMKP